MGCLSGESGLKTRLMTALAELPTRSSLVEAIKYVLGHWAGLTVFLEDGQVEVDTNTVERTMRPIAITGLFCPCRAGRRRPLSLASSLRTARARALQRAASGR